MRSDKALEAANPTAKVDRILSDLLGNTYDLLSDTGRDAALEVIGKQDVDETGDDVPDTAQVPDKNRLPAWKAARSLCAALQINAAVAQLDTLEPLPDEGEDLLAGTIPDDFATARRQLREQLHALRDEYAEDNDAEVIDNIYQTLFGGGQPLFDRLREAGNYVPARINDRADEKHMIHYIAVRGLVAMLCGFGLDCKTPTREPDGQSSLGENLDLTEHAVVCARDTGRKILDELEGLGLSSDCTTDTVPGLEFGSGAGDVEGAPDTPKKGKSSGYKPDASKPVTLRDLFGVIDRVDDAAEGWLSALADDGRRGAHLIRGEVDRLATKAQRFRPKPPAEGKDWPLVARLVDHFVEEMDRAARGINRMLET